MTTVNPVELKLVFSSRTISTNYLWPIRMLGAALLYMAASNLSAAPADPVGFAGFVGGMVLFSLLVFYGLIFLLSSTDEPGDQSPTSREAEPNR